MHTCARVRRVFQVPAAVSASGESSVVIEELGCEGHVDDVKEEDKDVDRNREPKRGQTYWLSMNSIQTFRTTCTSEPRTDLYMT